jgi:hypothetical protein
MRSMEVSLTFHPHFHSSVLHLSPLFLHFIPPYLRIYPLFHLPPPNNLFSFVLATFGQRVCLDADSSTQDPPGVQELTLLQPERDNLAHSSWRSPLSRANRSTRLWPRSTLPRWFVGRSRRVAFSFCVWVQKDAMNPVSS